MGGLKIEGALYMYPYSFSTLLYVCVSLTTLVVVL